MIFKRALYYQVATPIVFLLFILLLLLEDLQARLQMSETRSRHTERNDESLLEALVMLLRQPH